MSDTVTTVAPETAPTLVQGNPNTDTVRQAVVDKAIQAQTITETPTPATPATPAAPAAPAPSETDAAADAARRALYEKHYGSTPAIPAAEPVVPATPAPAATQLSLPPEFVSAFQTMAAELAAVKAAVAPPPAPVVPGEPEFVTLLREGKTSEAIAAMAKEVKKLNQAETEQSQRDTVDQAVSRAREVARAEADVESFVKELRAVNPELSVMEAFVTSDAQARLAKVQATGVIKTTEDAVREYKRAVLDATETARKIAQQLRGAGKTEAMVRSREVLNASTPTPQQVVMPNDPQPTQETTEVDPTESARKYFESRQRRELGLKNPLTRE